MGVCKCKQRNVTNQFCYVCRMNVCESCIVKDHERCVIKSYVHWLQDSDYSNACSLCMENIEKGEIVRLTCYDLFHWSCLNKWALKLAETSQPASFKCPDCKAALFPPAALVSPVADVIRKKLSTVGWGRKGLGLPPQMQSKPAPTPATQFTPLKTELQVTSSTPKSSYKHPAVSIKSPPDVQPILEETPVQPTPPPVRPSVQQTAKVEPSTTVVAPPVVQPSYTRENLVATATAKPTYVRDKYQSEAPTLSRKVFDTTTQKPDQKINVYDNDENKYKRKSVTNWISNVIGKKSSSSKKESHLTYKRAFVLMMIMVVGFMTIVLFLSKVGSGYAGSDPMLDPNLNPNIKVQGDHMISQ